jgi:hypothetical protein
MFTLIRCAAASAALCYSLAGAAQVLSLGAKGAPLPPEMACELHIYPAPAPRVLDTTATPGLGLGVDLVQSLFAVKDPAAVEKFMDTTLSLPVQKDIILSIDYSSTSRGRGRKIVVHDTPHDGFPYDGRTAQAFKKNVLSLPGSTSKCHDEVILRAFSYKKSTSSSIVRTGFIYRSFGTASTPSFVAFGGHGDSVRKFPPRRPDEAPEAAEGLRAVYRDNLLRILNDKDDPGYRSSR